MKIGLPKQEVTQAELDVRAQDIAERYAQPGLIERVTFELYPHSFVHDNEHTKPTVRERWLDGRELDMEDAEGCATTLQFVNSGLWRFCQLNPLVPNEAGSDGTMRHAQYVPRWDLVRNKGGLWTYSNARETVKPAGPRNRIRLLWALSSLDFELETLNS